ncbi:MAG: acetyl-CoA carboxylase biotin carboxyl carrier protein [Candidatus Neomarinimicrobiota bacterium]
MWQDKLKEIIYILENSNVNEIEVSFWGRKYRVAKQAGVVVRENEGVVNPISSEVINLDDLKSGNLNDDAELIEENSNNGEEVLSPMPGTFYSSPTPEDDSFVVKGSQVKKGQTLCIIEAMKIMNEIESEFDGVILEVKVNNSEPVEYNQPLFIIQPS